MENYNIDTFECQCGVDEHRLIIRHDEAWDEYFISFYLVGHYSFLKRLWVGIKYIFKLKNQDNQFQEFMLDKKDVPKFLDIFKEDDRDIVFKTGEIKEDGIYAIKFTYDLDKINIIYVKGKNFWNSPIFSECSECWALTEIYSYIDSWARIKDL